MLFILLRSPSSILQIFHRSLPSREAESRVGADEILTPVSYGVSHTRPRETRRQAATPVVAKVNVPKALPEPDPDDPVALAELDELAMNLTRRLYSNSIVDLPWP
jgi:hypothetical protein